jgi:signal transduction histidine kinase
VAACTIVLVAGQQVANVVLSQLPPQESLEVFNDLPIFVASVALVSILPYATNINLNAQLRSNAATDERARLAREIHDGLCQTLSGLRWQTQLLSQHLAEQDKYAADLHRLEGLAREAEEVARGTLRSLQGASATVRFLPLIKSEVERLRKITGVNGILLDQEKGLMELDPSVERQLAYICQEALRNVEKHSRANNLVISLRNNNSHLMITIADDGVGFNPAEPVGTGSGSGLRVMKERAESVGGHLQIVSQPGHGTQVDVDVPRKPAPEYIWQKK